MKWYIQAAIYETRTSILAGHIDGDMTSSSFVDGIKVWKEDCMKGLAQRRGLTPDRFHLVILCAVLDT